MSILDNIQVQNELDRWLFPRAFSGALKRDASAIDLTLIALFGVFLSIISTGYVQFDRNHIYYLPIVGALYDLPQFANDSYVQSTRWFSSGIWLLLEGSSSFVDVKYILFPLLALARLLTFLAVFHIVAAFGYRKIGFLLILSVLLSFSNFMQAWATGGGNLFGWYFHHSEVANGTLLFSLSYAFRKKFGNAVGFIGITFFLNAFMAVWLTVPVVFMFIRCWLRNEVPWQREVPRIVLGSFVALILSFPVLYNIITNPEFGSGLSFDFLDFLYNYFPYHFVFHKFHWKEYVTLFCVLGSGLLATRIFLADQDRMPINLGFLGFVVLCAVGAVLPFVSHSRLLLDLHLIRSAVGFWLLSIIIVSMLTASWLTSDEFLTAKVLAPLMALLFFSTKAAIVPGFLFLLAYSIPAIRIFIGRTLGKYAYDNRRWVRIDLAVLFLLAGVYWPYQVLQHNVIASHKWAGNSEWGSVAAWAFHNTAPDDVFLVGTYDIREDVVRPYDEEDQNLIDLGVGFEFLAQRRIWVFYQHGAAVMWSPSYYGEWNRRITEVLGLRSIDEKLTYAQKHRIAYIIDPCKEEINAAHSDRVVFQTRRLCIYSAVSINGRP